MNKIKNINEINAVVDFMIWEPKWDYTQINPIEIILLNAYKIFKERST
jgi:hypothetical protein